MNSLLFCYILAFVINHYQLSMEYFIKHNRMSSLFNNTPFRVYLLLTITFLSISMCTNNYTQNITQTSENDNIVILNQLSNDVVAVLLMPIYISYRSVNYIYNNFDKIINQLTTFIRYIVIDILYEKIILNIYNFIEYCYTTILLPFLRYIFVDILYEKIILNIYNFIEYCYTTIFLPFLRYIFVDIFSNIYNLINYIYTNIIVSFLRYLFDAIYDIIYCVYVNVFVPFIIIIKNVIINTFNNVIELLIWGWNILVSYVVLPIYNMILYLYSIFTGTFIKILNSLMMTLNDMYLQISNIFDSLIVTLNNAYIIMIDRLTQSWNNLTNLF